MSLQLEVECDPQFSMVDIMKSSSATHPDVFSKPMKNISTIGERVAYARQRAGLTAAALAKAASLTRSSIHQIEHGLTHSPKPANLFAIARACSVRPEWIVYGEGLPDAAPSTATSADDDWVNVPRLGVTLGPDRKPIVMGLPESPARIPVRLLATLGLREGDVAVVEVADATMERTLHQGDSVLVDVTLKIPAAGRVSLVLAAGALAIRRLHPEIDGSLTIACDNEARGRTINVPADQIDRVEVVGRAVYRWGRSDL